MKIFIHDELPPETSAMLQALYSRSAESVETHLEKVRERGATKFMESYYVGYGHASIGDCGYTTLYIENVSILACKAIQDTPLYSGQETSTRYIDFSRRPIVDPLNSPASQALLARFMEFYASAEAPLVAYLREKLPCPEGKKEALWAKAISARAFDILRGFLPAGVTSQLAWTTNFRQAHEHISKLSAHPLSEVRDIAAKCRNLLRAKYPSSFSHKVDEAENEYLRLVAATETYMRPDGLALNGAQFKSSVSDIDLREQFGRVLTDRPKRSTLPKSTGRLGHYTCTFALDFGSFRDLQRHRGGICEMPLLTEKLGMHPWYFDQLPAELADKADDLLATHAREIAALKRDGASDADLQYYMPMGMYVSCRLTYDLAQMVYVSELRSGATVHPTLREIAQQMGAFLNAAHPTLRTFIDNSPDQLCLRRGEQDIVDRRTMPVEQRSGR